MDSRFRGNDVRWRSGSRRADHQSRLRGNDITDALAVIPAKAGIHRLSPTAHARALDASIASILAVIPATAEIQGGLDRTRVHVRGEKVHRVLLDANRDRIPARFIAGREPDTG